MTPLFNTFIKYFVDAILIGVVVYVVYMTYKIVKDTITARRQRKERKENNNHAPREPVKDFVEKKGETGGVS